MFENGGGEGGVEVWFGHFRTQTQKNCLLINFFIGCWIPTFDVFLTSDLAGNRYQERGGAFTAFSTNFVISLIGLINKMEMKTKDLPPPKNTLVKHRNSLKVMFPSDNIS